MKKINFEEAIKALEEGKKVYINPLGSSFLEENKRGVICGYKDNTLDKYNWCLHVEDNFYLPEEPKPFEITETGLYKTRDGRRAFVAAQRAGAGIGCIDDFPMLLRWDLTGEVKDGYVAGFDIIGKWEDETC